MQPVDLCWVHPPSAGGPGNGLVSIAELLDKIHIHIPDGNTDKLGAAATAWKAFNQDHTVANADVDINDIMKQMSAQDSPEIADITEQLTTLYDTARHLWGTSNQLIDDVLKLKKALDDLRKRINKILDTLDLALAGGLILSIAADFFSAGAATSLTPAEVAAADAAVDIAADETVQAVTDAAIEGAGGILESAAAEEDVLASAGDDLQEIGSLTRQDVDEGLEESTSAPDSAGPGGSKPTPQQAQDIIEQADRTGSGLKGDPWHRSASFPVDEIAEKGTVYEITGGDGVTRTLVQMPGEVNGVSGRFEWIVDGDKVTHQMFVKNGTINGVPITK
ncbi:hypothetical protein EBN03_14910 [Nocardia stercoris]|uniref:Uncharacterized protein n=1 Tax=Nocardia stercoris TaxID=2483361 RepID=A0A3M2L3J0_9NOCA|nr:hypothetical protein EBN03_14910 [Nocardia stercoris]